MIPDEFIKPEEDYEEDIKQKVDFATWVAVKEGDYP